MLEIRFDILWRREKEYKKKNQNLKPGLVAEQLIPNSVFTDADQVFRKRIVLGDIRMPLTGTDYRDEKGNTFQIDSLNCITMPVSACTSSWKESGAAYDRNSREEILSALNYYGQNYLVSEKQELFIPNNLIMNESCAACSFVKDCLDNPGFTFFEYDLNDKEQMEECRRINTGTSLSGTDDAGSKTAELFSSFWEPFEEKLITCKNRDDTINCLIDAFRFLKENPFPRVLSIFNNAVINLKNDMSEKGDMHAKT